MNWRKLRRSLIALGLMLLVALTVATGWPASARHAHADADLTVNPTSGPPGITVTVSPSPGTSTYPAGTTVTLYWVDCASNLQQAAYQVGQDGQVPTMTFTVPASSASCAIAIVVLVGQTGVYGPYTFDVTAGPPVPPGPILVDGVLISATANIALNDVTIGAFTDDAELPASSYSVSISWGDGTGSSATGSPARAVRSGGAHPAGVTAQYIITGSHTYASVGIFPIEVTIHAPDGRTAYLRSNAEVAAASPTVSAAP